MKRYSATILLAALLAGAVLTACTNRLYYYAYNLRDKTRHHKLIAILPPQVIMTGHLPKKWTAEDAKNAEEQTSLLYLRSLNNSILTGGNRRKKVPRVGIQSADATLNKITSSGLTLTDAWGKTPKEMADLLGVDAVVSTKVYTKRYMSATASYALDWGSDVAFMLLREAGAGQFLPGMPASAMKTSDIYLECSLIDGTEESALLWHAAQGFSTSWQSNSQVIANNITQSFGRHFPYHGKH